MLHLTRQLSLFTTRQSSCPGQAVLALYTGTMAPTSDEIVDTLKGTVEKLEQRVLELESRLQGKVSGGSSTGTNMRMILMGPPGAGTSDSPPTPAQRKSVDTCETQDANQSRPDCR